MALVSTFSPPESTYNKKVSVCQWSPDFVQEIPLVAQKTALLYHLSYLCLAKFPSLERIIRGRAVETQLLFGSSEETMLKCIETSDNLVTSLFPMLTAAVEQNKTTLEVHLILKARTWIKDIITEVDKIVERYDSHNKDVASSTSDVIQEKGNTNKKITEQDQELKLIDEALNTMISELQKTTAELAETENKINGKTQEIQEFTRSIQLQIIDQQMKAARANFNRSSIPDPVHLNQVQESLTKIQNILVQLRNFWEKVGQMLDYLEQKTFVGEDFIQDLAELKDAFLDSIKVATEAWSCFGEGCKKASVIFKLQSKDAYKFLEVSPPSLCSCQWRIQYESVKKQLEEIDPPPSVTCPVTPAIAE
ncbi:hypothetical protein F2P79_019925 [Pimephales promelas]|nr:hypothetical protein F2P79_019925 [Pimephales promelas]